AEQTEPTQNEDFQRGPTPIPPPAASSEETPEAGYAIQYAEEPPRPAVCCRLAGMLLVAVLDGAAVIGVYFVGKPDDDEPQVADDSTTDVPAKAEASEEPEPEESEEDLPDPVPASVERVVPGAPELSNEYDADLPAIVDGNKATAWHTLTFTRPDFGG